MVACVICSMGSVTVHISPPAREVAMLGTVTVSVLALVRFAVVNEIHLYTRLTPVALQNIIGELPTSTVRLTNGCITGRGTGRIERRETKSGMESSTFCWT